MFRSVSDQFTCKSKRCQGLTVNFSIAVPLLQRFAEEFFAYPKNTDCSKLAEAKVIKLSLWLPSFQVCPFPPLAPPPPFFPLQPKRLSGLCQVVWSHDGAFVIKRLPGGEDVLALIVLKSWPNTSQTARPTPPPPPPPPSMAFSLRLLSTKSSATSVLDHTLSRLVFRGARI